MVTTPAGGTDRVETFLFARARAGMKLGLERMQRALAAADHPERCAPAFHVAGTNGKGSTCAFLERACREQGLRTGLYTSPHLERFTERFRIDGTPVWQAAIEDAFDRLRARVAWAFEPCPEGLTFFELVTLLGFEVLADARPAVQVVEVGLGGRLDATNTIEPAVSCIAPIGLDHEEFLGSTLDRIAAEKAGIIKPGVPVVVARQEPSALAAIEAQARAMGAPLSLEGRDFEVRETNGRLDYVSGHDRIEGLELGLLGAHQLSNAAVALRALEVANERGTIRTSLDARRRGIALARWPGRLEIVRREPLVILDGAHNGHAAQALARTLPALLAGRKLRLVLGVLADKSSDPMLDALLPLAHEAWITQPPGPRALPSDELATRARSRTATRLRVEPEATRALEQAVGASAREDAVLGCGSLYLAGLLRAHLNGTTAGGPSEILR